jgi:hypothetical protein
VKTRTPAVEPNMASGLEVRGRERFRGTSVEGIVALIVVVAVLAALSIWVLWPELRD